MEVTLGSISTSLPALHQAVIRQILAYCRNRLISGDIRYTWPVLTSKLSNLIFINRHFLGVRDLHQHEELTDEIDAAVWKHCPYQEH